MKRPIHKSNYFCGHEISPYGREHGYIDYRTFAKAFDAVLVNDITKLFYNTIGSEYIEPEQVNGYIDNTDEINELQEQIEELEELITEDSSAEQDGQTLQKIKELQEQIEELEREQDEQQEIFQYFIVSDSGAELIQEYTNDPLYYLPLLDCYVWGVTHWGTSWDYVLTDCKIVLEDSEQ